GRGGRQPAPRGRPAPRPVPCPWRAAPAPPPAPPRTRSRPEEARANTAAERARAPDRSAVRRPARAGAAHASGTAPAAARSQVRDSLYLAHSSGAKPKKGPLQMLLPGPVCGSGIALGVVVLAVARCRAQRRDEATNQT